MRNKAVDTVAEEAYEALARAFPVCSWSDEFTYFPQVLPKERRWSVWDDFSGPRLEDFTARLKRWEGRLEEGADALSGMEEQIDCAALLHALRTLREQLEEVCPHRTQPTWHLTVAAAGLAEALDSVDPRAWTERVAGLPGFLDRALRCLDAVPALFLDLGLRMVRDLQTWMEALRAGGRDVGEAAGALKRFGEGLGRMSGEAAFFLRPDLVERIVSDHLGYRGGIDDALREIDDEIGAMEAAAAKEASRLAPGCSWVEASKKLPFVEAPQGEVLDLYRQEVSRLEAHCRAGGILPPAPPESGLLEVASVPGCLSAIRASDAYSARPGHPPRGGTFTVLRRGRKKEGRSVEYRMTAAHETWPGHHLLDCARWSLPRPLRRPLERPLFYEGWACLAEEIMFRAGCFGGDWDRFVLAGRRLRRAVRGQVDIGLQSGRMGLDEAISCLEKAAFSPAEARAAVPAYALRPGYQVCYTLGVRKFLSLFETFGEDAGSFAGAVLAEGEIDFEDLGKALLERLSVK
jgi:hypothetical protein